jgi:hypothetical protein
VVAVVLDGRRPDLDGSFNDETVGEAARHVMDLMAAAEEMQL